MTFEKFILQVLPWILLGIWTLYSIVALFFRKPRWSFTGFDIIQHIPATFITLGVLGTFAGVTYGLLDFNLNPEEISQSISTLLGGLTNAFITSLYGLFLSVCSGVIIRHRYSKGTLKDPEVETQQLLLSNLKVSIDTFGENLAKYNSEAIMSSLKKVIEDFNDTFTELIRGVGYENFQNLTRSVDQLVEWQEEYREDVSSVLESNKEINKRTEELLQSYEKIDATISQISNSALELKSSLDTLRQSIEDESSLSGLITQLETTTENLVSVSADADLYKNEVERIVEHLVETQKEVKGWLDKESGVLDAANAMNHTLVELREFDIAQIEKLDESFTNRLEETFENLDRLMKSYIQYLEEQNGQVA
ncbi:MAG: hypothetical protein U5K69_27835 [Balneolaceae bacterium]|nr:hypothetical protein [Balneolaceae bacterium]